VFHLIAKGLHFCFSLVILRTLVCSKKFTRVCLIDVICGAGDEKTHLKVTLLRIDSTLQGVLSCLPDFRPSPRHDMVEDLQFFIAGASGSCVGSAEIREKTAITIHAACK